LGRLKKNESVPGRPYGDPLLYWAISIYKIQQNKNYDREHYNIDRQLLDSYFEWWNKISELDLLRVSETNLSGLRNTKLDDGEYIHSGRKDRVYRQGVEIMGSLQILL